MRTENCAVSCTTDVGLTILPVMRSPLARRRQRQIDDVEAARDRLPARRRQVDLLEHRRRQLLADVAHRALELLEARAERRHLGGQRGARRLLALEPPIQVRRRRQRADDEQEHDEAPQARRSAIASAVTHQPCGILSTRPAVVSASALMLRLAEAERGQEHEGISNGCGGGCDRCDLLAGDGNGEDGTADAAGGGSAGRVDAGRAGERGGHVR